MKTKIFIITLLFTFFIYLPVYTQVTEQWHELYDGTSHLNDAALAIAIDNSGNTYVTGQSDNDYGYGSSIATVKYDASGTKLWDQRWSGGVPSTSPTDAGYSIAVSNTSHGQFIYVTGVTITNQGGTNYVTIQYSDDGTFQWAIQYQGPYAGSGSNYNLATHIEADADGNAYVTGYSMGDGTGYDFATIKYDINKNIKWVNRYNNNAVNGDDEAASLKLDNAGNVYVTGFSQNSGLDGPNSDMMTIAYANNGNQLWASRYNGSSNTNDYAYDIAVDGYYNAYITGQSDGQYFTTIKYDYRGTQMWVAKNLEGEGLSIGLFRKGCSMNSPCFQYNVFITGVNNTSGRTIMYNQNGVQQWCKDYDNSALLSLVLDQYENVYVTGHKYFSQNHISTLTLMYDKNGVQQWEANYDNSYTNISHGVKVDGYGNVYITGYSSNTSMLEDYLTIKYIQNGGGQTRFQNPNGNGSNENNIIPASFSLAQNYPNPFNPVTLIKYDIPTAGFVKISVFDLLGHEVKSLVKEYKGAGSYTVPFDGSSFGSGVYFYRISSGDFTDMKKMILVK